MPRTTAERVAKILEVDSDIDLAPFIEVANELVTECCGELGYTENRLTLIEDWLAAHFYAQRDPRLQSEGLGSLVSTFEGRTDLGLNNTRFGQQAMRLDTQGGLAALEDIAKNPIAKNGFGMFWLGSNPHPDEGSNL
jgi:hypothetical protein